MSEAVEDGFRLTGKQTLSFTAMMCLSLMAALDGSSISVTLPVGNLLYEILRHAYDIDRLSLMSWVRRPLRLSGQGLHICYVVQVRERHSPEAGPARLT